MILAKVKAIPSGTAAVLGKLENNLLIPALVLYTFATNFTTEKLASAGKLFLLGLGISMIMRVVGWALARLFAKDETVRAAYTYGLAFANFSYMGHAVAAAVFPEFFLDYLIFTLPMWIMIYVWGVPYVQVRQGELLVTYPYQIHYYENCRPGVYRVILNTPELLYGLMTPLRGLRSVNNVLDIRDKESAREYVAIAFAVTGENRRTVVAGYCHLLMVELLALIETETAPHSEDATFRQIMEYCQDHYQEDLTLALVAEQVHLSKYYISRLFKKKLKRNFSDYINTLRVRRASRLLEKTDKKIADISEDVGSGSIRSFNRAFLDIMKMTPKEFRSTYSNQKDFQ